MAEITRECIRPDCTNRVSEFQAIGTVDLFLERRVQEPVVNLQGEICAGCSNDLADWWNRGKK